MIVLWLVVARVLLGMPPVSPVDAGAQHGDDQYHRHGECDETRKGHARALDAVGPGGLAVLLAPCLAAEERQRRRGLAVLAGQLLVVEAGADEQLAWIEPRRHCREWVCESAVQRVWGLSHLRRGCANGEMLGGLVAAGRRWAGLRILGHAGKTKGKRCWCTALETTAERETSDCPGGEGDGDRTMGGAERWERDGGMKERPTLFPSLLAPDSLACLAPAV